MGTGRFGRSRQEAEKQDRNLMQVKDKGLGQGGGSGNGRGEGANSDTNRYKGRTWQDSTLLIVLVTSAGIIPAPNPEASTTTLFC